MTQANTNQTEAHWLHGNPIFACLQILVWLIFRPSVWRDYLKSIDTNLHADFAVTELSRVHLRNPHMRRLLIMIFGVWSLLAGAMVTGQCYLLDEFSNLPRPLLPSAILEDFQGFGIFPYAIQGSLQRIPVVGGVYVMVGSFALAAILATAVSVASGALFIISLTVITIGGYALSVLGLALHMDPMLIQKGTVVLAVATAIAGTSGLASTAALHRPGYSPARPRGGPILGILSGTLTANLLIGCIWFLAERIQNAIGDLSSLPLRVVLKALCISLPAALGFMAATKLRTRGRRRVLAAGGSLFACLFAAIAFQVSHFPAHDYHSILIGFVNGLVGGSLLGVGYVFAYAVSARVAGVWAGLVAGATATAAGGWLVVNLISQDSHNYVIRTLGIVLLLFGVTILFWRPILSYPIQMGWHLLLLDAESRRLRHSAGRPTLWRWHPACWDEQQRLRLWGTDEYALLLWHQRREEAKALLSRLARSPNQRWVVGKVHLALDLERLAACGSLHEVAHVHDELLCDDIEGREGALLSSLKFFSQSLDAVLAEGGIQQQRFVLRNIEEGLQRLQRQWLRDEAAEDPFAPIVRCWQQLVAEEAERLASANSQDSSLDNPYSVGVPLRETAQLFRGRRDLGLRIERLVVERSSPPLLLYGQKRMGKTSLLNNLGRLLPRVVIPMYADLNRLASAMSSAGFLRELSLAIAEGAQRRQLILPSLTLLSLEQDPFVVFGEWLDHVEMLLQEHTALLMLDEFEGFEEAFARGVLPMAVTLGFLRNLIQHRPRFKILLAGNHTLDDFATWASYLTSVEIIHIGCLSRAETVDLIEHPVPGFPLRFQSTATERIWQLTTGHPYWVQLLCRKLVELKNEQAPSQRWSANANDVEVAATRAVFASHMVRQDLAENMRTPAERLILRRIASAGEGAQLSLAQLHDCPIEEREQTLSRLVHKEFLIHQDGHYRFRIEMMRRWFVPNTAT